MILTPGGCDSSPEEPDVISVGADDAEMDAAIQKSRDTVGQFIASLRNPTKSQGFFSVKKRIVEGEIVEHIWLGHVTFDGTEFQGRIENVPKDLKTVSYGSEASLVPAEISDWMYVEDGRLVGGFTIRVLRNRLSPAERIEFDRGMGGIVIRD